MKVKKKIVSLTLAALMAAGGSVFAQDLPLPLGHTMSFGPDVTVHQGRTSYFSDQLKKELEKPEVRKNLIAWVDETGLVDPSDTRTRELLADKVLKLVREASVDQIRMHRADANCQACVISGTFTEEDRLDWSRVAKAVAQKDGEDNAIAMVAGEILASTEGIKNAFASLPMKKGTSAKGLAFICDSQYMMPEQAGHSLPFYLFTLVAFDGKDLGFSLFVTDQPSGKIMEADLIKAAEDLK